MNRKEKSTTINNPKLHNPHLDGDAFFLEGGKTGIFISHGYTATAAEVRPIAEKLHAAGYTVAGPLLAGHGTQVEDLNNATWQDWVESGKTTLESLFKVCDQVWVAGESMGGVVALYLAAQNPKIKGVVLYAPAIRLVMSFVDQLKLYLGSPFLAEVPRDSLDCSSNWQGYPGLPLKGAIQLLRFQKATLPLLPKVTQPVLIFQGRKDMTVAPEAGEMILSGVSSAVKEHHWMENSSHAIVLDVEVDDVAQISLEFIQKNQDKE